MIIFIDISILFFVAIFSNKVQRLTFYNPMFWILLYHAVMVSFRLIQIEVYDSPLFQFDRPITKDEIFRAVLFSDLVLIVFCFAYWLSFNSKFPNSSRFSPLSIDYSAKVLLVILFGIGIISFVKYFYIPSVFVDNVNLERENSSSLLYYANSWILYGLILLIYIRGFKKVYIIMAILFMVAIALQGESRFRLLLPVIMLISIFLYKNGLIFPKIKYLVIGVFFVVFLFFPMKRIAWAVQGGGDFSDILEISTTSSQNISKGENTELMLLDMYAATLSIIDQTNKIWLGETYLGVIYMFVPRSLWPNKPTLTQWMYDISSSQRNLSQMGTTPSIIGESYANFRILGVIFIPLFYGLFMFRFYRKILALNNRKPNALFLLYMIYLAITVQVLRDGMISFFVFPLISFAPLTYYCFFKISKDSKHEYQKNN